MENLIKSKNIELYIALYNRKLDLIEWELSSSIYLSHGRDIREKIHLIEKKMDLLVVPEKWYDTETRTRMCAIRLPSGKLGKSHELRWLG